VVNSDVQWWKVNICGSIPFLSNIISGANQMAKSQDAKKNAKKQPTRTAKEKKALKAEKKKSKGKL